ncbi:hypothetical protein JCM19000A_25560 [Silvimonas sp. JCM 19000]
MQAFIITESSLAKALAEWERRCRADPDAHKTEAERRALTVDEHGACAAAYLLSVLNEQADQAGNEASDAFASLLRAALADELRPGGILHRAISR